MRERLTKLLAEIKEKLETIEDQNSLNVLRSYALGRKSEITNLMAALKDLPPEEKPLMGKLINEAKQKLEAYFETKKANLQAKVLQEKLAKEAVDVTLPGVEFSSGSNHILKTVIEDFENFFIGQGYSIKEGPDVELDYYNFEMLNIAKDHPARAMHDTFYVDAKRLLRSHTSPVQARTMLESAGKPIKIICPGKTYRRDEDDQYHSHQFMQIEGLVIDEDITMADLKGTLLSFIKYYFGEDKEIRLRPSYFPFTEPSVEVDIFDGEKYVEILGAGMVHPNVLKMGGYDPDKVQGFAFGIGLERIAMLKYEIDDIRHFYTNDVRFLNQFKGGKR
ncbi:MAG: phenylalanine--tRNA ligase subunit alpha [Acholeplasmataceae bacterium]|jgi:phenylalanyl-tRNA synthetase alpha chain|nr:phenylalanine--tRNA ligase subunit alpha [Acholeplasmataceae bacterium]